MLVSVPLSYMGLMVECKYKLAVFQSLTVNAYSERVFFSLRGGGSSSSSSSTRPPPGQNRVRTALGRVRTRGRTVSPPVRTRVRACGPRVRTQKACFFFPGGGGVRVRVRVRVRRGRRQVKIEFELLWGEFEREFELCHRQFELEFEHMDRESGLRKLGFFSGGGGVPVRVRVRAGLTMQDTKPGCSRSKSQEDHGIEWQRLSELRTLSCRHQTQ